jgi:tryptophan-rich sensory protein
MKPIFMLIVSVVICQLAGLIGSIFNFASIPTWYAGLTKPSFNPPNWVFGPVWTLLFLLMGISFYLVWSHGFGNSKIALWLFILQLVLNILWSALFFGLRNPGIAFVEIVLLWISIAATIFSFYSISRPAAWLMVPYIFWVTFAAVLNFSIWMLNK